MLIGSSYNTQKFESANIVKDKVYLLTPSSDKYSYADVVVGKIKYEDGSTWELENADEWIKYNTLQVKCALFKGKKAASVPSISTISSIYAPSKM